MAKASVFSETEKLKWKEFQMPTSCETMNKLLQYLWAKDSILAEDKEGFAFAGEVYCLKTFSKITGISEYLLRQVYDCYERGLKSDFVHEGRNSTKLHEKSINFISWFQEFSKSYGQYAPDEQLITLPSFLTRMNIFQLYKDD